MHVALWHCHNACCLSRLIHVACNRYHDYNDVNWQKMYAREIEEGSSKLTLGGESCSWSEHAGPANLDHRIFKTLPAVAERLWSPESLTKHRPVASARVGRCHSARTHQTGNAALLSLSLCFLSSAIANCNSHKMNTRNSFTTHHHRIPKMQSPRSVLVRSRRGEADNKAVGGTGQCSYSGHCSCPPATAFAIKYRHSTIIS